MRDLRADWRKWTRSERLTASLFALVASGAVPTMLLLGHGELEARLRDFWEDLEMPILIGPIVRRPTGYGFDTWSGTSALRPGYPYRRIEDAHYARKAAIREHSPLAIICQTVDEFMAKSGGAMLSAM